MNMKKTIGIILVAILSVSIITNQAFAHKIDKYKNLLNSNVYTLKCIVSNKTLNNGVDMNTMMGNANDAEEVIVIRSGDEGYTESPMISMPDYKHYQCVIKTNGKNYAYSKYIEKGKSRIEKYASEMIFYTNDEYYGNQQLASVINIIKLRDGGENEWVRPANGIITDYGFRKQFVAEGINDSGYNYEDYKVYTMNMVSTIVRFIFDGDKLIEIDSLESQEASKPDGGSYSYSSKTSIKINEFTDVVDHSYFKLPEKMKILTAGGFR